MLRYFDGRARYNNLPETLHVLNYKRLFRWLPWLSAVGLTVVFLLFMSSDLRLHQHAWNERLRWDTQAQRNYLDISQRHFTHQAVLLAQLIGGDQAVTARIRAAHQAFTADQTAATDIELGAHRRALQTTLQDYWGGMETSEGRQLSLYFAPDGVSFFHMHHPERYGDSFGGLRPLITTAFTSGLPASGTDVAPQGSGYRAVLPITAGVGQADQIIAVLEVGLSLLPHQSSDQPPPGQMAVFLRKSAVERILWEQVREELTLRNPTTVDDWRLEETSDPQIHQWWHQGLVPIGQQGHLVHSDNAAYLASWWPLQQAGRSLADSNMAVLVWNDVTPAYADYLSARKHAIARWLTALVCAQLLLLLFVRLNRRFILNLIQQHRAQIHEEHTQSEQARQRLALALRSSDSGFWEWDIAQDKARFSPEWRQLCGIGPESPNSLDLDEWMGRIHPADKRTSYSDIIRHIKGETPMYENEYRIKVQDGSFKWILTRGKVVEWASDGKAALMLGVYTDITHRKTTELINIRQQAALHSLNEIASLSAVDPDEQLRRALGLGARYLGVGGGAVTQISGGRYKIHVQLAAPGQPDSPLEGNLDNCFCSLVLSRRELVAEDDIPASGYREHPAYVRTHIESYIGAPLWINGEIHGTLCFTSRKSRHHPYDTLDQGFVRLLARWISSVVERLQQDAEKKVILQRFQKLSERLPGFLYQFQLRPDGSSFFPYASSGIKNICDVEPEDVADSAEKMFSVIHPDDAGWVGESISYSAAHLTPWVATVRINNPERGMIWAHIESIPERLEGGSVLWHGYVSDITPLKQAELKVQETNSLHKAILDAASVAIISTDNDGLIKTFNHGAELMLGYTAEQIIDRHTPELFHLPDEVVERADRLSRELGYHVDPGFDSFIAKAGQGSDDEYEWHYVRKDGTQLAVLLTVTALRAADGEITGYLGIARDISEIKRIDQMKTEFISTVSHELRTPLTAISGALGILVNGLAGNLPEQSRRMIQIAHNNSLRLIHLVNDLLDMEKLVAGKMHFEFHPHMLRALIQQSMDANAAYAQQYGVTYELQPGYDVQVSVDHQRLLQVLANYLSNAAKFSPFNDVVRIEVQARFGSVRVRVSDNGPGVPDNFRARLFQKFSQADSSDTRQKGGTGLGLAICKEIIERMGGKVGMDQNAGKGACFYFDLRCEDPTRKTPSTRTEPTKNKPHLLVVEDDADAAEVLAATLTRQKYDVDLASSGKSALEHLQLRAYDVITLDLHLPDLDGIAVVEHIRQQESHLPPGNRPLPIIIIAGAIDEGKKRLSSAIPRNAIYWLEKPLVTGQLEQIIARALDQSSPAILGNPE